MDQNYVQRYHAAASPDEANKSVWLCVWIYVPVSLLFFIIGTCLYTYYMQNPELLNTIKLQAASEQLGRGINDQQVILLAARMLPSDYADKVMPHFMVHMIPTGLLGLIVSAILSAAMSTISSGMNASATVFTEDIYKRYFNQDSTEKNSLRVLYIATVVVGLAGMLCGIAMIGIKSLLDVWWTLSGIFAGGMLGLFLLGIISKHVMNRDALTGTVTGILVILWMTFSYLIPPQYDYLRNPLHANMIIVVGTLSIFLAGNLSLKLRKK